MVRCSQDDSSTDYGSHQLLLEEQLPAKYLSAFSLQSSVTHFSKYLHWKPKQMERWQASLLAVNLGEGRGNPPFLDLWGRCRAGQVDSVSMGQGLGVWWVKCNSDSVSWWVDARVWGDLCCHEISGRIRRELKVEVSLGLRNASCEPIQWVIHLFIHTKTPKSFHELQRSRKYQLLLITVATGPSKQLPFYYWDSLGSREDPTMALLDRGSTY